MRGGLPRADVAARHGLAAGLDGPERGGRGPALRRRRARGVHAHQLRTRWRTRRTQARSSRRKAVYAEVLTAALAVIGGGDLRTLRDRTLLVFGMACCLRRSELVALLASDLERVPEGLRLTVRHFKIDQQGRGAVVAMPEGRQLPPMMALETWLRNAGVTWLPQDWTRRSSAFTRCAWDLSRRLRRRGRAPSACARSPAISPSRCSPTTCAPHAL